MNEVCRMFMWHYLLPCKKNMDGINFHSYMCAVIIPKRNRNHVEIFPCGTVFILSTYFFPSGSARKVVKLALPYLVSGL